MAATFSIFENDVLSLHFDVQAPQYVGDEFLYVLMAAVGEGDASALSVGRRRRGGDDPFRIDDDGLIVGCVNCTNAMRDPACGAP